MCQNDYIVRVIKETRVQEWWTKHRQAKSALEEWLVKTKAAKWERFNDVQKTFKTADSVTVSSGRQVVVFDIKGGKFRLIAPIHYDRGKVFAMLFMTHAEYSKDKWKDNL